MPYSRHLDTTAAKVVFGLPVQKVIRAWTDADWWANDTPPTEFDTWGIPNAAFGTGERSFGGEPSPPAWVVASYSSDCTYLTTIMEHLYLQYGAVASVGTSRAPVPAWRYTAIIEGGTLRYNAWGKKATTYAAHPCVALLYGAIFAFTGEPYDPRKDYLRETD